jgi:hypothetical protein
VEAQAVLSYLVLRKTNKTQLLVGRLILEQSALEKKISALRDEFSRRARVFAQTGRLLVFQPERLAFDGDAVGEDFAGEAAIDRKALDVDSLIADLRAAIIRRNACASELAEMGLDPEEGERERNLRASRALFHPANALHSAEDGGTKRAVGFTKPRKRAES